MFGRRFFGGSYFGAHYFGQGGSSPGSGEYFGNSYFGVRYYGGGYFGPYTPATGPSDYFGNRYFGQRYYGGGYFGPYAVVPPPVSGGKSHTALYLRQLLVEHYEREFNKPKVKDVVVKEYEEKSKAARPYDRIVSKVVSTPRLPTKTQYVGQRQAELVASAEEALANETPRVVEALLEAALKSPSLELDLKRFVERKRRRETDELLLLTAIL